MATTYYLTRWVFLRLVGLVYLVAVLSLAVQVDGLIGSSGLQPVSAYLERVDQHLGPAAYWRVPTLCWISSSDAFLHGLLAAGIVLALLVVVNVATRVALVGLWAVYLSLVVAGQVFLSFQWDGLLLETGLLAALVAPWGVRPRAPWREPPPPGLGMLLIWCLLFKLMFLSGVVKLLCMDETWWGLTALDFHYSTQPLPTWTSWYAHHWPSWFQKISVAVVLAIEIPLPFLIFAGARGRRIAAIPLVLFQLLIAGTGNYGFFNLLTLVLCLALVDDAWLLRLLPRRVAERHAGRIARAPVRLPRVAAAALVVGLIAGASALTTLREMVRTVPPGGVPGPVGQALAWGERSLLSWGEPWVLDWLEPFRSINGYGLFRRMTTVRPEIVLETSDDGREWREIEFRFKPGDVTRAPRFVAPHMPRLDWQMWFAALDPQRAAPWLGVLSARLLDDRPEVWGLLDRNPDARRAKRFLRFVGYRYEFTTPEERRASGAWWRRQRVIELTGPLSRPDSPRGK